MSDTCYFICGDEDYLVARRAKGVFEETSKECTDSFNAETIHAVVQNADELNHCIQHAIQSLQTLSLLGGKKVVWLRNANWFRDAPPGNTEAGKKEIEKLLNCIESLPANQATLVLSACPVDRRTKHFKRLQKLAKVEDIKAKPEAIQETLLEESQQLGLHLSVDVAEAMLEKLGHSARQATIELHKLADYLHEEKDKTVTHEHIATLVPAFGDSHFFETSEAFFSGNLEWTLDALDRHFFTNPEARPILTAIKRQTGLLIQLRSMIDGGQIPPNLYGNQLKNKLASISQQYEGVFKDFQTKSGHNVFTQHPFYLSQKLLPAARRFSLRKLLEIDQTLQDTFQKLIEEPKQQHNSMRTLAIRCLS